MRFFERLRLNRVIEKAEERRLNYRSPFMVKAHRYDGGTCEGIYAGICGGSVVFQTGSPGFDLKYTVCQIKSIRKLEIIG